VPFDPANPSYTLVGTLNAFPSDGMQLSSRVATSSTLGVVKVEITVDGPAGSRAVIDDFIVSDPTPDEAPIEAVARIGDIDGDTFPDIILGAPHADFLNILEPCSRRQASGEAYIIYGNKLGLNAADAP
jgi:hypothetical protein